MSAVPAAAILLKCVGPLPALEELQRPLRKITMDCVPAAESIAAHAAVEGNEAYVYLFSRNFAAVGSDVPARVVENLRALPDLGRLQISAAHLQPVFDAAGASSGQAAPFHYVVETDVVPEHEADLNAWYDVEHMPGLAACPGSVRARRFRNPDGSPRYHSCYDLASTETLGSEPWLAVRHSAWSDRVRPHFRNTRRTMFRRLFEITL
ncbi:MAG: hypothetical protein WA373_00085 [Burkholderiales bacterium]